MLSFMLSLPLTGPAAADECMCRANGERFELGSVVCLKLPSGDRLARCGKVLNNTSWKMLGDGCPITSADEEKRRAEPSPLSSPKPG